MVTTSEEDILKVRDFLAEHYQFICKYYEEHKAFAIYPKCINYIPGVGSYLYVHQHLLIPFRMHNHDIILRGKLTLT